MKNQEEIWKDVEGYEGLYQVSYCGKVKSLGRALCKKTGLKTTPKMMTPSKDKYGYTRVNLTIAGKSKNKKVHRLVSIAFHANPENKPQVNHKDGNKLNNHGDNLEFVTGFENIQHAVSLGLFSGSRIANAKLNKFSVVLIRNIYSDIKVTQKELASIFGVTPPTLRDVLFRKTWKDI